MEKKVGIKYSGSRLYRWSILLFVSLTIFGSYLAYDSIGPIAPTLKEIFNFHSSQVGLLYSIYSIPNIIMVLFGGFILDRIGTRRGGLMYVVLVFAGVLLTAVAPLINWAPECLKNILPQNWSPAFLWMLAGRFIFGLGSESLVVAQSAIIGKWFKGHELALAFGINLTISRLGTFAAFNTFGWISTVYKSIMPVLWLSVLLCGIAVLTFVVYMFMEKKAMVKSDLLSESEQDRVLLKDIYKFPVSFWYISALCVLFYSGIFPFTAFSTDFFCEKWKYSQAYASQISSIIIFFSMVFTPVFGALIDKFGRRGTVMIIGSLLLIPPYLIMGYTDVNPIFPMSLMGIAFSLVPAAMWPSMPLIISESRLGTAYGLMTMIQNVGLSLFPFIVGWIRDTTGSYEASMLLFSSIGFIGLIFSVLLCFSEKDRLEKPKISLQQA